MRKALTAWPLVPALAMLVASAPARAQAPSEVAWLTHARAVAVWLERTAESPGGWPDDALVQGAASGGLANGQAGRILFQLALYRATEDLEHLTKAREAGEALLEGLPERLGYRGFPRAASFYYGHPGVGFALHRLYLATGDPHFLAGAERVVEFVKSAFRDDGDGRGHWDDRYDEVLFGNAGTALFLVYAHERMNDPDALDLAIAAGYRILDHAQAAGEGFTWVFRRDRPEMILPNFSHGAAGIGYVLATIYQASGRVEFLEGARKAALMLESIAEEEDEVGGVWFPYGYGNEAWRERRELGWAHGVAGTAKLFQRLAQITGDARWERWVDRIAITIDRYTTEAALETDTEAGTLTLDRRFGVTGAADFLVGHYRHTGEERWLRAAERIGGFLVARGSFEDGGLYWETARPVFVDRPGEPARFTGWFTGAAGYGLLFVDLAMAREETGRPILQLDDPHAFVPVLP